MPDYEMTAGPSRDIYPRTTEELVTEYAQLNHTIAEATKRRESLDVQFQKIMEQQQISYQGVRQSAYPQDEMATELMPNYTNGDFGGRR